MRGRNGGRRKSDLPKVIFLHFRRNFSVKADSNAYYVITVLFRRGLAKNPNSYGPLTDGPDYSFLDGRPTPPGSGKIKRAEKHLAISVGSRFSLLEIGPFHQFTNNVPTFIDRKR